MFQLGQNALELSAQGLQLVVLPMGLVALGDGVHRPLHLTELLLHSVEAADDARLAVKPFAEAENQFVLRMKVENRPGVLASIAGVLGAHQVSISKVVQKIITDGAAELVIVTDAVKEMAFGNALEDLKELEITREIGNVIREY